jgi:hypothetical protein
MEQQKETIAALKRILDGALVQEVGPQHTRPWCQKPFSCLRTRLHIDRQPANDASFGAVRAIPGAYTAHSGAKKRAKRGRIRLFLHIGAKNASGLKSAAMPRGYWTSRAFGCLVAGDRMLTPSHAPGHQENQGLSFG